MIRQIFSMSISLWLTLGAYAQSLPSNAPAGMDPLSAIFVEACAIYAEAEHDEVEFLVTNGFRYSGPILDENNTPGFNHSSVYRSLWDPNATLMETAQIHFFSALQTSENGEELRFYACRLIVHERPEFENRFQPESFFELEGFEDYLPPLEDQEVGITEAWERHHENRYTGIQTGSPEPNVWLTVIYSYPRPPAN